MWSINCLYWNYIANVVAETNLPKKDVENAVAAILDIIRETLVKGEKVSISGFGAFSVKTRAAREGINPLTKASMSVPETKVLFLRLAQFLKMQLSNI